MGIHYSREHINRLITAGSFPPSFRMSEHRICWDEALVTEWLAARANSTAKKPAPVVQRAPLRKRLGGVS